ncbi:hypothetical protein Dimus_007074 [Dionaea muscipula]
MRNRADGIGLEENWPISWRSKGPEPSLIVEVSAALFLCHIRLPSSMRLCFVQGTLPSRSSHSFRIKCIFRRLQSLGILFSKYLQFCDQVRLVIYSFDILLALFFN